MRRLALELDLDSGTYTARMRQASRETEIFQRKIDTTHDALKRIDKGVNGATARLRDFTLIMGNLRSSVENARFFFTGLVEAAVSATSEIERVTFLLRGLSKETSEFGRRNEAQRNLEGLIATAKQAPFSLKALSDTFVKFKAGGLDPTNGSMNALLDAVAAFGGSDDLLHRASVAIQQMGGKGVISMEELRQQLGEAVPTAISLMAKGLGKSYFDLVKEISEGKVKAEPALKAMFEQFQIAFGGSAARMMETFRGRVAQLKTSLTELAMAFTGMDTAGNVAEGSFYDYLKKTVEGLTQMISSEGFRGGIAEIGTLMGEASAAVGMFLSAAGHVKDAIPAFIGLKDVLAALTAVIVGQFAARSIAALAEFTGKQIRNSQRMIVGLRSEQRARMDAARSAVEGARLTRFAADEAVVAEQRRKAALDAEKVSLMALRREELLRLKESALIASTGRNSRGAFASKDQGELGKLAAQSNLAVVGERLAMVNTQLRVTEDALTAAQIRQTAATQAETAAIAGSGVVGSMRVAINNAMTASLAMMNRAFAAAATGSRTFLWTILSLSSAQVRYNLGLAVGNGLLATMRVGMIAASVAARGLMTALSFFGGPLGIAIIGIAAAIMSVSGSLRDAKENAEQADKVFNETSVILNRMREEGIIAGEAIKTTGDNAAGAAEGIAAVAQSAMAAAKTLGEYAAAARDAAIAELDLQLVKSQGLRSEAEAGTMEGRARRINRANAARTGANGQRTLADMEESMKARWDYRMGQLANWRDGGRAEAQRRQTIDRADANGNRIIEQQRAIRFSEDGVYRRAFEARAVDTGSPSTGSGAGGGKGGGGKSDSEKGMDTALNMLERVQGIEAEIAGAGKEAAKMAFILADESMANVSKEVRDSMMQAATALDVANERMEGFRALGQLTDEAKEQEEIVTRLRAENDLISQGMADAVVENARYRAGLSDTLVIARQFNETEAEAAVRRAAAAQKTAEELKKQQTAMLDLQSAVTSSGLAADAAWEDFSSGAVESDRELNRYRRTLTLMLAQIPMGTADWTRMKAAMDRALDNFKIERATEALIEMRNATQEIERSFMTQGQRAAAEYQSESDRYRAQVETYQEGTEQRRKAEETYYNWKVAKEREIAMSNPVASMMLEWQDVMGNLTEATAGWIDTLVDGLIEGELNWKEFTASMLKEIAKIILRAMIAHAILSAMGMAGPGTPGATMKPGAAAPMTGPGLAFGGVQAHTGGIIGSPGLKNRTVTASMFNAAPRYHKGGIAGLKRNEVPTILEKKEGVFTQAQMKALAPVGAGQGAAPNVQVNVINESGQEMTAQQDGGLKFDGRAYILDVVIDAASKPGKMRSALQGVQRG